MGTLFSLESTENQGLNKWERINLNEQRLLDLKGKLEGVREEVRRELEKALREDLREALQRGLSEEARLRRALQEQWEGELRKLREELEELKKELHSLGGK